MGWFVSFGEYLLPHPPASIGIEGSLAGLGDKGSQGCEHLSPSVALQAACEGYRECYSSRPGSLLGGNNGSPVACHVHPEWKNNKIKIKKIVKINK